VKTLIKKYFPKISDKKIDCLIEFEKQLLIQNNIHNLISRKDEENIFERHILHSLAIAKFVQFKPKTKILDLGTGGGLPGIPLAIFYPKSNFVLCDSIAKKIKSVETITENLNLKNVLSVVNRVENLDMKFDFVVTRAVANYNKLKVWTNKSFNKKNINNINNGLIALKGGDVKEEVKKFKNKVKIIPISDYFEQPFFETKKIVYLDHK